MSAELCTSEQAIAALGYLNRSFGGYPMTEAEQRPYLRLFRSFDVNEVQNAIDLLARSWTLPRRPMPNDVAQAIHEQKNPKSKRDDGPYLDNPEPPPPDFSDRMANLKMLAQR